MQQRVTTARLIAVGVLGCLLLNYPLLSLADRPVRLFGVPVLWMYLFGVWVLLITLIGITVRKAE